MICTYIFCASLGILVIPSHVLHRPPPTPHPPNPLSSVEVAVFLEFHLHLLFSFFFYSFLQTRFLGCFTHVTVAKLLFTCI